MPTNLAIDDRLINEAVTAALKEYIQRRKQLEILNLLGKIEYDESYDYKQARRKR